MAKSSLTNEAPDEERGQDSITAASLDDVSKQIVDKTNEEAGAARGAGELEKWNRPRINIYRYLATLYSFVIMGMNDAAYGVSGHSPLLVYYLTNLWSRLLSHT